MRKIRALFRYILLLIFILYVSSYCLDLNIGKIEPPNWWTGMSRTRVQLMIYGNNLQNLSAQFENNQIKILKIYNLENPAYDFIDIEIPDSLAPGNYRLTLSNESGSVSADYPVFAKKSDSLRHRGFDQSDIIYLITPDRFVNGDPANDITEGYYEEFPSEDRLGRHGGDIAGIISKLDYLKNLGVTTLWINPLIENNMFISYHGYSATDFYRIDPRFGSNELYKKLAQEAHIRGLKIIMDHVSNHIADNHPWMKNLPMSNWINGSRENHKNAIHDKSIPPDIHSAPAAREIMNDGWFADYMPDLNQRNPYVANYIIQNTIWWMEFAGLDGIREDTYPYADQRFLSRWAKAVLEEYPGANIVGEVWDGNPSTLAWYQKGAQLNKSFDSHLPVVTDFRLTYAFGDYLSGRAGLEAIYQALSQDFVYPDAQNLLTFIDNHDVQRAAYLSGGINKKLEIALQILLTTRGIPQIYYGTEIGLKGGTDHGDIREDFPGGFSGDERNTFTKAGRTEEENELFNLLRTMIQLRKNYPALAYGDLIHFPVHNNIYIYFRVWGDEKIMIVVNGNDEQKKIDLTALASFFEHFKTLFNLKTEIKIQYKQDLKLVVPSMQVNMYLLEN